MAFQWQDEAGKNISLSPRDYYAQYMTWSAALIAQLKQSPGNGKSTHGWTALRDTNTSQRRVSGR